MDRIKSESKPIVFLTHVVNRTVTDGYLPAAIALGLPVYILTDQALAHQAHFGEANLTAYPTEILDCDVFNAHAIIELLLQKNIDPAAIFSNSDHIQAACAQAASFFGLPSKNWATCYRAKNKFAMRQFLQLRGMPSTWFTSLHNLQDLNELTPVLPCVVKPQQGVASVNVQLCETALQLENYCRTYWQNYPGQALIAEEFIPGMVFTVETLGDGEKILPLGGFDVQVSSPPHFIEKNATWVDSIQSEHRKLAFEQLRKFGVGFGCCHGEFVLTPDGPRLIEINYRTIGGNKDFLINRLSKDCYFKQVIKIYLGEKLPNHFSIPGEAVAQYYTAAKSGRLVYQPKEFECEQPFFMQFQNLKQSGDQIVQSNSDRDRLSILIAHRSAENTGEDSLEKMVAKMTKDLEWEIC